MILRKPPMLVIVSFRFYSEQINNVSLILISFLFRLRGELACNCVAVWAYLLFFGFKIEEPRAESEGAHEIDYCAILLSLLLNFISPHCNCCWCCWYTTTTWYCITNTSLTLSSWKAEWCVSIECSRLSWESNFQRKRDEFLLALEFSSPASNRSQQWP